MFERKNQKLEHYRKVVEESVNQFTGTSEANGGNSDEEDFLTVKRVDHPLSENISQGTHGDLSKRKLKIGQSKRLTAKYRGHGEKLVFDEEGTAHQVYELKNPDELIKQGVDVVQLGKEFAEEQRGVMKEIDLVDKAVAKQKKREKKRKAKEREKVSLALSLASIRTLLLYF